MKISKWLFLLVVVMFFRTMPAQCQSVVEDVELISEQSISPFTLHRHKPEYLFKNTHNPLIKYNPVSLVFGSAMYIYQSLISPQINAQCLYQPSCSHFSIDAIREYGILKGVFVSADRLTRCNRIAALDIFPLNVDEHSHRVVEDVTRYRLKK